MAFDGVVPLAVSPAYHRHITMIANSDDNSNASRPWQDCTMGTATILGEDNLARPLWAATDPMLRNYYDTEWGMPVRDEHGVFERLSLEAFQAGLSWATILRKRENFREAFAGFDPEVIERFGEAKVEELL